MSADRPSPVVAPASKDVAAFLDRARQVAPGSAAGGRLVFALDATMSRQPTWDSARVLQAEMFQEAAASGGLAIQLVYFRGLAECRASNFVTDADKLASLMQRIDCRGGHTQIGRVLSHTLSEHARARVQAAVFVGDAMEEKIDDLCTVAGQLGLLGVPLFMFQEGSDPIAEQAFREMARLSRGAYGRFDAGAARQLADLLRAVAAYAAGGRAALAALSARRSESARHLLAQLG